MKKLGLLVMPLMAVSLLASCGGGGGDKPGPTPGTTYTLTFNCTNCRACDENDNEITSIDVPISDPTHTTYQKYYFKEKDLYKKPLESSITVKKTGKEESIEFDYDPTTGEIEIPVIDNLTITASGINKTLEECTWAEIDEISTSGRAEEFFAVYDPNQPTLNCKRVQLTPQDTNKDGTDKITAGETNQTVRIIGFNHDYTDVEHPNESKVGITFEFAETISDFKTYWNNKQQDASKNYDFVHNSNLNECLQPGGTVYKMMPSDLMSVVKTVNKKVEIHPNDDWIDGNYNTQLFPLSYDEVDGDTETFESAYDDDDIYEYYKVDPQIRRKKNDDYWLRTPYEDPGHYYAWLANKYTSYLQKCYEVYQEELCVAPAFCI